jgi:hypothetical protein
MIRWSIPTLLPMLLLAACAGAERHPAASLGGPVPPFAARGYEPFSRQDAVAIALDEWRLFGQRISGQSTASPAKAERQPGLWQRIGEYWWIGQGGAPETGGWTGKHDAAGRVFPASEDARFAWSAAFISYVMRVAGAGDRFPYAPDHAAYVNAAASGRWPALKAWSPAHYAPRPGDLLCFGRGTARTLTFRDLPTDYQWPGHCAIMVAANPGSISVIGGNVDDAVTLSYVPVGPDGRLSASGTPWFVILAIRYDTEVEPSADR